MHVVIYRDVLLKRECAYYISICEDLYFKKFGCYPDNIGSLVSWALDTTNNFILKNKNLPNWVKIYDEKAARLIEVPYSANLDTNYSLKVEFDDEVFDVFNHFIEDIINPQFESLNRDKLDLNESINAILRFLIMFYDLHRMAFWFKIV